MHYFFEDNHFQQIFNRLPDGIFITDENGVALWSNDTTTKQLGVPRSKFIGKNVIELESAGLFSPSVTRSVIKKRTTVSKVQTSNNRQFLATGFLVSIPNENIEYVLVQVKDITETVKASLQLEKAEELLQRYLSELEKIKREQARQNSEHIVIGSSKKHKEMMDLIDRVAHVDATILLLGETGVGKSMIAEEIHKKSERSNKPFVQINCSAIPENLLESELFGYTKGAFTGASSVGKEGLVERAHGGTLFLDEIAELPLVLQAKILQLVQNKSFISVGSTELKKVDIRIITATNENLEELVAQRKFREDLYYRLHVVTIDIPPLRERQEDIIPLVYHYFNLFQEKYRRNLTLSPEILEFFQAYRWPGNIRELENMIERLIITSKSDEIQLDALPKNVLHANNNTPYKEHDLQGVDLMDYLETIEKQLVTEARDKHLSTRKAARALGLTQSSFIRRLKKYNLS